MQVQNWKSKSWLQMLCEEGNSRCVDLRNHSEWLVSSFSFWRVLSIYEQQAAKKSKKTKSRVSLLDKLGLRLKKQQLMVTDKQCSDTLALSDIGLTKLGLSRYQIFPTGLSWPKELMITTLSEFRPAPQKTAIVSCCFLSSPPTWFYTAGVVTHAETS